MKNNFLLEEKFRTNTSYHLVEWNELTPSQRENLAGLQDEREVYGIFQPKQSSATIMAKVAYKEIALLYLHLNQSQQLPRYLTAFSDEKLNETVVQLILDHILEIRWDGHFVSGTAALNAITGEWAMDDSKIPGHLVNLSLKGIRYAWMLRDLDARSLAQRLYTFNTTPWDGNLKSDFQAIQSVLDFLRTESDLNLRDGLKKHWRFASGSEKKGWLSWSRSTSSQNFSAQPNGGNFKLYFSPKILDLPDVFAKVIPVLSASSSFSFKAGCSISGLLRPDKMVAYFEDLKGVKEAAAALENELHSFSAQGVPFTAQLGKTGLLSWGFDPPKSEIPAWSGGSWRAVVTDLLANAILQAQRDDLDDNNALRYIRAKLVSAGVNTADWTPLNHFS